MSACRLDITFWRSPKILETRQTDDRCKLEAILWMSFEWWRWFVREGCWRYALMSGIWKKKVEPSGQWSVESEKSNLANSIISVWSDESVTALSSLLFREEIRESISLWCRSEKRGHSTKMWCGSSLAGHPKRHRLDDEALFLNIPSAVGSWPVMSRVTPCPLKIKFYYRFQGIGGPYALSSTGLGQVIGFAP